MVLEAVAPDGYSGDIALLIGIDADGNVTGVRVTAHRETPGLGDYIDRAKSAWIDQFAGKSLTNPEPKHWKVTKDGGVFDARAGATITPRAVVKAVRSALDYFARHRAAFRRAPAARKPSRQGDRRMMTMNEFRSLFHNGLIKQNTGLVQLLGLCPLLAISNNVVNALSLGLATTLVMAASSGAVSGVRHFVPNEIRIPVFVLIIAALVTVIDLAMNAFVHPLYLVLGIFIPLITTNCIVLARADAFAAKNRPLHSVVDAIAMGLGLTLVLVVLGGMRELVGQGTLFSGIDLVFGEAAKALRAARAARLPGLSARHPAARRLHRAGPADRRATTGTRRAPNSAPMQPCRLRHEAAAEKARAQAAQSVCRAGAVSARPASMKNRPAPNARPKNRH